MFCNGFPFVPMGIFLLPNTFSTSTINIVHVKILQILLYDLMSMLSKKCFDHALGGSTIFAQLFGNVRSQFVHFNVITYLYLFLPLSLCRQTAQDVSYANVQMMFQSLLSRLKSSSTSPSEPKEPKEQTDLTINGTSVLFINQKKKKCK